MILDRGLMSAGRSSTPTYPHGCWRLYRTVRSEGLNRKSPCPRGGGSCSPPRSIHVDSVQQFPRSQMNPDAVNRPGTVTTPNRLLTNEARPRLACGSPDLPVVPCFELNGLNKPEKALQAPRHVGLIRVVPLGTVLSTPLVMAVGFWEIYRH
jgi:hypothetical protein